MPRLTLRIVSALLVPCLLLNSAQGMMVPAASQRSSSVTPDVIASQALIPWSFISLAMNRAGTAELSEKAALLSLVVVIAAAAHALGLHWHTLAEGASIFWKLPAFKDPTGSTLEARRLQILEALRSVRGFKGHPTGLELELLESLPEGRLNESALLAAIDSRDFVDLRSVSEAVRRLILVRRQWQGMEMQFKNERARDLSPRAAGDHSPLGSGPLLTPGARVLEIGAGTGELRRNIGRRRPE